MYLKNVTLFKMHFISSTSISLKETDLKPLTGVGKSQSSRKKLNQ